MQKNSSASSAVSILLSSVILLGNIVALILYFLFLWYAFIAADSPDVADSVLRALFVTLFCATPLAGSSLIAQIARWRQARHLLVLTLIAGLVSGGYFVTLLLRLIPH